MRRKIEAEVRAKLTDEFLANFLLGNDDDEDDAELLRFGAGGSVELSDGWQETLNSAIDREIDAAKRIAEKQIDTTVRNRVANSQPRQVSSEDLVRGQVDRTLVRTALQRESREIDQRLHPHSHPTSAVLPSFLLKGSDTNKDPTIQISHFRFWKSSRSCLMIVASRHSNARQPGGKRSALRFSFSDRRRANRAQRNAINPLYLFAWFS